VIDELPTRAALTVAAVLLLATGLSLLGLADEDALRGAAHGLAAHVARQIDALAGAEGELLVRGGVGVGGELSLPAGLAGRPYRLEIRSASVTVIAGGHAAAVALGKSVLPFAPDRASYTSGDLAARSASIVAADVGDVFLVERTERFVDGVPARLTFVHLPH